MRYLIIFCLSMLIIGCGHKDGTYCADINYHYPKTGTRSDYTLLVDVENNRVNTIYWNNGGHLDSKYFTPPRIVNGRAKITTSEGKKYKVKNIRNEDKCH